MSTIALRLTDPIKQILGFSAWINTATTLGSPTFTVVVIVK